MSFETEQPASPSDIVLMVESSAVGYKYRVRGPCRGCGIMFRSRCHKLYCCLKCYTSSDAFRAARIKATEAAALANVGVSKFAPQTKCDECGCDIPVKKPSRRCKHTFCGTVCYRSFFSKRFDRFIANPESVALPQNFDEFLDRDELDCPIAGCGWSGKRLTFHANVAHGISKRDFKMACGFNLKTGVVSRDTSKQMSESAARRGLGLNVTGEERAAILDRARALSKSRPYRSLEGREHWAKSTALRGKITIGPMSDATKEKLSAIAKFRVRAQRDLTCASCGDGFTTKSANDVAKCKRCVRAATLERNRSEPWQPIECGECRARFMGTRNQVRLSRMDHYQSRCATCIAGHGPAASNRANGKSTFHSAILRALRLGVTDRQIMEMFDVSRSVVYRWKIGETAPTGDMYVAVCSWSDALPNGTPSDEMALGLVQNP